MTTRILSLNELQKLSIKALESISKQIGNRQYALAAGFMASAQHAYSAGDMALCMQYVERAKVAHKRAQEDERGQMRRMIGAPV